MEDGFDLDQIRMIVARLKSCCCNEHCEITDCAYFTKYYDISELLRFVEAKLKCTESN